MAVPAVAVVKGILFAKKFWKEILTGVAVTVLGIMMFVSSVGTIFMPSAKNDKIGIYKDIGKAGDVDPLEMLAYDTVKNDNNFSNTDALRTSFDFLACTFTKTIFYIEYVDDPDHKGQKIKKIVPRVVVNVSSKDFDSTCNLLNTVNSYASSKFNLSDKSKLNVKGVKKYLDEVTFPQDPPSEDIDHVEYKVTANKLSFIDVISKFDNNHREWAINLLGSLMYRDGSFENGNIDLLNPEGSNMSNIVIDPSAYVLGDLSLLSGDTDCNKVFEGRLAKIAEVYQKKVVITSGYRSVAEQQAIWDATSPERRGVWVAAPGHSRHQYGIAADVSGWLNQLTNRDLEPYGLWKPMSYESWHIEPVETKGTRM